MTDTVLVHRVTELREPLVLANGSLVSGTGELVEADLLVCDGRIVDIGSAAGDADALRVDCSGCLILPEITDLHVHLRDPGQTHKETIETGCRAALAGGVTRLAAMPNTFPLLATPAEVEYVLHTAREKGAGVDVLPVGAAVMARGSSELSDAAALRDAGCAAISDDGFAIQDAGLMREVLAASAEAGLPFLAHCEDLSITGDGVLAPETARVLGVTGIPAGAESTAVERNIALAVETGARLHVMHVSEAATVALMRQAKRDGLPLTCEACPHHFALTADAALTFGANAKMSPPLRTEADRQAVLEGLFDGTVDAIASDHAPHTAEEKAQSLAAAPCGIVGLETLVAVSYTELVAREGMPLAQFAHLLCERPAGIVGRDVPRLAVGEPARLGVFELESAVIGLDWLHGMGRSTPFIDFGVALRPVAAVAGDVLFAPTWRRA